MICRVYNVNTPEEVAEVDAFSPMEAVSVLHRNKIIKADKAGEVVVDYTTATGREKSSRYKVMEI